ncbi:MAG: hypothetical protein ACK5OC_00400 [Pirellula sp.]
MSNLQRSVVVIPSYSVEELPNGLGHEVSSDFLNAWTVGWDARLLVCLGTLPEWKRPDSGALELENALVLCPEVCREKVDIPQRERLGLGNCVVIDTDRRNRPDLFQRIATSIRESGLENEQEVLNASPVLGEDFYALGYAVLQVQILARKLRYSWNIDWIAFTEQVMNAAKASIQGDTEETERWIQASFDTISQERDRYCSQQIYLLDVVLLAESTLGEALTQQLGTSHPFSILATSTLLQSVRDKNPDAWQRLKEGLKEKQVSIVGGLQKEYLSSYRTYHALFEDLREGRESYESLGVSPPTVFSMFAPGVSHLHADLLRQFGYAGALLNAWSGGKLPELDSAKILWQTHSDAPSIDCVLGHVKDMSNAESLLHWTSGLSKQLDYHQIPTIVLAHWPNRYSEGIEDLFRVIKRSPSLGSFESIDNYFSSTNQPYSSNVFTNTQFKIPVPDSTVERTALRDRLMELGRVNTRASRLRSTAGLWHQVAPTKVPKEELEKNCILQRDVENFPLESAASIRPIDESIDRSRTQLLELIANAAGVGAASVAGGSVGDASGAGSSASQPNGYLVVNPCSHPQRVFLKDLHAVIDPQSSGRIHGCVSYRGISQAVVDLPPFGFVKLRASGMNHSKKDSSIVPLVRNHSFWQKATGKRTEIADTDWTMSNEYMELQIDPKRGHLRSVYVPSKRGSRMSGMPSIIAGGFDTNRKWKEEDFLSSELVSLKIVENSSVCGCIEAVTSTKLSSGAQVQLRTRYTLWRGARWLHIQFATEKISTDVFHAVWRTAWANESATIAAWQQGVKGKLPTPLQASIELVEIDDVENKIYVAAKHNPVHQRFEMRYLVTALPSSKDGGVSSELAVGMDWSRPYETAMDFVDSPWIVPVTLSTGATNDDGAWLAQSNVANVRFEFDSVVGVEVARDANHPGTGGTDRIAVDAVLWVFETQGKRAQSRLSFFKNVEEAWRIDAIGQECCRLDVEDGQVLINLHPSEQCRVALRWTPMK